MRKAAGPPSTKWGCLREQSEGDMVILEQDGSEDPGYTLQGAGMDAACASPACPTLCTAVYSALPDHRLQTACLAGV